MSHGIPGTTRRVGSEEERGCVCVCGHGVSAFIGVEGVGLVFCRLPLLVNLTSKCHPNLALYLVVCLAMCLLEIAIFKMNASVIMLLHCQKQETNSAGSVDNPSLLLRHQHQC